MNDIDYLARAKKLNSPGSGITDEAAADILEAADLDALTDYATEKFTPHVILWRKSIPNGLEGNVLPGCFEIGIDPKYSGKIVSPAPFKSMIDAIIWCRDNNIRPDIRMFDMLEGGKEAAIVWAYCWRAVAAGLDGES